MRDARCPSCGTKVTVPEGQPLPRCKHCWSPLVEETSPTTQAGTASRGSGLDALFAAYEEQSGTAVDAGRAPAAESCCPWCGAISEPGLFCSDCGSSLLSVV